MDVAEGMFILFRGDPRMNYHNRLTGCIQIHKFVNLNVRKLDFAHYAL